MAAAPPMSRSGPVLVAMTAFEGVNLLDVSGPLQAFEACRPPTGRPLYRSVVVSVEGGPVLTAAGLPILTEPLSALDGAEIDTLIAPGGSPHGRPAAPAGLVDWIAARAGSVRRVCSVCSGAFLLAEAGLLDGRRAATHWRWARLLQDEHPDVKVDPDPIFIEDGGVWTSAGVTAGIDMALALIERDFGHRTAIETAKRLVVFMKRPGGQSQFSAPLAFQSRADTGFSDLHAWIRQNLASDLRVDRLAQQAGMSERTFARTYAAKVGHTPAKTVEAMRLEAACAMLETSPAPLKQVAAEAGFGEEQNLRRVFLRRLGVTPADYRRRFSSGAVQSRP